MELLQAIDRSVLLAINGAHAPWLDAVMLAISDRFTWIPVYVLFLLLVQRRTGWRGLWWSVPVVGLMILCSDKGSVELFKETAQRLRPCHEPELIGFVRLVPESCGGQYGFISSHASNHFAIAVFMIAVLRGRPRWSTKALIGWALLIAYSRVYLGVHYPGDVLVGGLFGALIGTIFAYLFNQVRTLSIPTKR